MVREPKDALAVVSWREWDPVVLLTASRSPDRVAWRTSLGESGVVEVQDAMILVVEDEALVRMPVAEYLRECGYRVAEAADAAEAQALFRAGEPIRILFSDIQMPGEVDGLGLASWVRREYPDVRIVLTSGRRGMAKSAADLCHEGLFLDKPYCFETLNDHFQRLLGASSRAERPS